jgi:hypothetical protein
LLKPSKYTFNTEQIINTGKVLKGGEPVDRRRLGEATHLDPVRPVVDLLTLFGLFAVTMMLVYYALEHRSPLVRPGFRRRGLGDLCAGRLTAVARQPVIADARDN